MSIIDQEIEQQAKCKNGEHVIIKILRCTDKDGDDFDVDIHPGSFVNLSAYNHHGIIALTPNQARELAAKILAEVPAEEEQ